MGKTVKAYPKITIIIMAIVIAASCNNRPMDIPFPIQNNGYAQPVTIPLQFTAPKKLHWVTKTGGIHTAIKKFDINALPSTPYDTAGFKPFDQPPTETHFSFDSLPSAPFNLDNIPSKPLHFKTELLPPPVMVKSAPLVPKAGTALSIFDVGKLQGLYGKNIYSLFKDKKGFIWIATDQGLYRYDGEYMKIYFQEEQFSYKWGIVEDQYGRIWYMSWSGGLWMIDTNNGTISNCLEIELNGYVDKLMKDDRGRIWVTNIQRKNGLGKDVCIIDPTGQTFKQLNHTTGLSDSICFGISEDWHKNIWLATYGGGADIINLESGRIRYLRKRNGLAGDSILTAVTNDKTGQVWLKLSNGTEAVDLAHGTIKHYGILKLGQNTIPRMLFDNEGRLWASTYYADSRQGLELVDPEKSMVKYITRNAGISSNDIRCILLDNEKRVWIGTDSGLNIIEENGEQIYPIGKTDVSTLLEDTSGKIWVGGLKEGIEILDPQKKLISYFKKQQGLGDNTIQNFLKADSNIWVTTSNGVDVIAPLHKTIEHIGSKEGLTNDTVSGIIKDARGNVWLAGSTTGIDVLDYGRKTIKHASTAGGLSENYVFDIKQDSQGMVWVALWDGVDLIDPENGTIRYWDMASKDAGIKILAPDDDGRMWIGTNNGIFVADAMQRMVTTITKADGLPDNKITSLIAYKGSMVAATKNKIAIITPPNSANTFADTNKVPKKWKISLLARSENLVKEAPSTESDIITKDGRYLWGDKGITIIKEIKEEQDSQATYVTGLTVLNQPMYFQNRYILKEKDTLWNWNSDSFYTRQKMPVAAASAIGLQWDSVSGPYNMPVSLRLPFNQNYIQFQYAQAHLGKQDTAFYCYILQGFDRQWSAFTSKTVSQNYSNLLPGNYIFKVCSKGLNGLWGKAAVFTFTITPPWWQTWWAYCLYIVLGVFGLWAFAYQRSKQLIRHNKLLEHKIKLRTAEIQQQKEEIMAQRDNLEKTLAELQATQAQLIQAEKMASLGVLTAGIAHEIQNPLNFVNNFSEVSIELVQELKEEIDKLEVPTESKENIGYIVADLIQNQQKINNHGKRADSIVKGMLLHSRTNTGQKEPTDINQLADEYLRLSYHGLRAKDKNFNARVDTSFDAMLPKLNVVAQDIGRVLLNLFTNAFYAVMVKKKEIMGDYQPVVSVSTEKKGNFAEIRVRDNGMGIPKDILHKIYNPFFTTKPTGDGTGLGLSLSYEIITQGHGGSIHTETKEGEFAEFIIRLPL